MPFHQASILQEWNSRGLPVWRSQGHYLEGLVAITYDLQQGLRVGSVAITDDGDFTRL